MDWLSIFKSKTYGKIQFSIFIFTLLTVIYFTSSLIARYIYNNSASIFIDTIGTFLVFTVSWWMLQVFIPFFIDFAKQVASWSPFSQILYLRPKNDLSNLIWQGGITVVDSLNLSIAQTDRGVFFKNIFWKNFIAFYDFKFEKLIPKRGLPNEKRVESKNPKENFLGFIFRAQDFDNYFMLQIGVEVDDTGNKKVFFRPHIRINGEWEVDHREVRHPFHINKYNQVKCIVNDVELVLELNDVILGTWSLPTHSNKKKEKEKYTFGDTSLIPFRDAYGMIGFRSSHGENAMVKDIKIVQLH